MTGPKSPPSDPFTEPAKGETPYWLRDDVTKQLATHRRLREKTERLQKDMGIIPQDEMKKGARSWHTKDPLPQPSAGPATPERPKDVLEVSLSPDDSPKSD